MSVSHTDPLLTTLEPSRPQSMLDGLTDEISAWEDASGARRTVPPTGGLGQGGTRFLGEAGLPGEVQQRYDFLKQKATELKRNLRILIKAMLEEEDTAVRGIITASDSIKAARMNWLNGIVEKSLAELSTRKSD